MLPEVMTSYLQTSRLAVRLRPSKATEPSITATNPKGSRDRIALGQSGERSADDDSSPAVFSTPNSERRKSRRRVRSRR